MRRVEQVPGGVLALLSAVLFGVSPVLVKSISGAMPPILMAGTLYFGSGAGLLLFRRLRGEPVLKELRALPGAQQRRLAAAVLFGGILAPVCLTYGIRYASAFQVSALLPLETLATVLLAALLFREHVSGRVWLAALCGLFGGVLVSLTGSERWALSPASLWIAGACVFWAIDNNLTREIEDLPAGLLAGVKGLLAGLFNLALAVSLRQSSHAAPWIAACAIGMASYGLSLVLFVSALRRLGAARTGAYFASAPFIGMAAAVAFLGERPSGVQGIAAVFMLAGVGLLSGERHEHEHTHEAVSR